MLDELRVLIRDNNSTTAFFCFSTQVRGLNRLRIYGPHGSITADVVTGTIDRETVTHTAAVGVVAAYTTVFVEMTVAATLKPVCGTYDIQVTHANGKKQTAFSGACELLKDSKS